jgi:predicted cupin superfamily sugar epimerase
MDKLAKIILDLRLIPHPEGGFFRETYRSAGVIKQECIDPKFIGKRNYSSCIYFLLTYQLFSAFHSIIQDEIWHFYDGSPVRLSTIARNGDYSVSVIGRDIDGGDLLQFVVPGGTWVAAEVLNKDEFALVGCTVSPGFDYMDFELPDRDKLISEFPQHKEIITRLTRVS